MRLETDILQKTVLGGQIVDLQRDLAGLVGFRRKLVGQLTSDHVADDIRHFELGRGLGHHVRTVAHDGDIVGNPLDFRHLVRNVDNTHTAVTEHVDDPEQVLNLFFGQRGGGFVEDNDLGLVGDRLGDFHHLPLGNRHGAHDASGIHIDAELFKDRLGILQHFLFVDHDPADGGIAPQPDVVHDRALERLVQLLVHHGHAV